MYTLICVVVVLVTQSCPTLCDPMDCSPPGSSVHGFSRQGILEWVAILSPGIQDRTLVFPILHEDSLPSEPPGKPKETLLQRGLAAAAAKSLQSCLTLCDLIDGSPPGSPVPGILQERVLEWVAIAFSAKGVIDNLYVHRVIYTVL